MRSFILGTADKRKIYEGRSSVDGFIAFIMYIVWKFKGSFLSLINV